MIPKQGCVIAPDGSIKGAWQELDPKVVLHEIPGSMMEDANGNKYSVITPEDTIVDLTHHFLGPEFQLIYRDRGNARARKDENGVWRFYLLYPSYCVNEAGDNIEVDELFEDEHPIERVRTQRIRREVTRGAILWEKGIVAASEAPTFTQPSLMELAKQAEARFETMDEYSL